MGRKRRKADYSWEMSRLHKYGAENHAELKSLLKKTAYVIGVFSVVLLGLAELLASLLLLFFTKF